MSRDLKRTRPALGGVRPMTERIVVVLPTPLRPSRQTHSPVVDLERDAEQHAAQAVGGVHVLERQQRGQLQVHQLLAEIDAAHLGVGAHLGRVASAIRRPWCSTAIFWAIENTTSMSCSVNSSVSPRSRGDALEQRDASRGSRSPTCRRSARRAAGSAGRSPARCPARAASGCRSTACRRSPAPAPPSPIEASSASLSSR